MDFFFLIKSNNIIIALGSISAMNVHISITCAYEII